MWSLVHDWFISSRHWLFIQLRPIALLLLLLRVHLGPVEMLPIKWTLVHLGPVEVLPRYYPEPAYWFPQGYLMGTKKVSVHMCPFPAFVLVELWFIFGSWRHSECKEQSVSYQWKKGFWKSIQKFRRYEFLKLKKYYIWCNRAYMEKNRFFNFKSSYLRNYWMDFQNIFFHWKPRLCSINIF